MVLTIACVERTISSLWTARYAVMGNWEFRMTFVGKARRFLFALRLRETSTICLMITATRRTAMAMARLLQRKENTPMIRFDFRPADDGDRERQCKEADGRSFASAALSACG